MKKLGIRSSWTVLIASLLFAMIGCGTPQATAVNSALQFPIAAQIATDGLASQIQKLPSFLNKLESKLNKRAILLDPMIDAGSGQQLGLTKQLEQIVTERLNSNDQFEILPFDQANLPKSQYLLIGTTTSVADAKNRRTLKINLALVDLKSGNVVAQASSVARDEGLDATPTAYYQDSPVLVKDKVIDGYIRTAAYAPGQHGDQAYLDRLSSAPVIQSATEAYNNGRYEDSLKQYKAVAATPAGQQLRVLNGIYLDNKKLGKTAEAEAAFSKIVALGIANNVLGVKFLFNPGSTDFWSDTKISGAYPMWLRQIAREASNAKVCMSIIGHTSHTGSEQTNDALSLQRATYIKQKLDAEVPALSAKTKPQGKGFRENMIGSGTDDVRDALDRRVEFKIEPCGA
jgi:outer membrane protein OmpA-like peptidoglycan-associated protein